MNDCFAVFAHFLTFSLAETGKKAFSRLGRRATDWP